MILLKLIPLVLLEILSRQGLVDVRLKHEVINDKDIIWGVIHNSSGKPVSGKYLLITEKTGAGGTSSTRQSGEFSLEGNDSTRVSTVQLALVRNDKCKVSLRIYSGDSITHEEFLDIHK
jgi:hypothetical protein